MSSKFELIISQNNEQIHTVTKEVKSKHFVQSLEEFQIAANETLTKMIEDLGHVDANDFNMNEEEDSSENEEDIQVATPKKKKM